MNETPSIILDGRYELLELLGEGGMGQVFKARHLRLGKIFAIKTLRNLSPDPAEQAKFLEVFEIEARTLAELSHPALAQVSDFFEYNEVHYLVMEFVNGNTLARVLELAPKLLSQRRVVQWSLELCDVLHYLHTQRPPIIVRDLKPENVMLDDKRRLRLLDFGISKRLQAGVGTRDIIKGMGTAEYAPLEQYGSTGTDQRSDIYALGGTLYCLLTEIPPPPAWRRASEGAQPIPPSQINATVTPELEALILNMMALKREDRPQSIAKIREQLQEISRIPAQGTTSIKAIASRAKQLSPVPSHSYEPPLKKSYCIPEPPKPALEEVDLPSPKVPPQPLYDESVQPILNVGERYGLSGSTIINSKIKLEPEIAPSQTGRIPKVHIASVHGIRRYATAPQKVRYCPGQPLIAVCGRYLQLWNTDSGQLVDKLWSGEQVISQVDFSYDGRFLTTAQAEGEIQHYDLLHRRHLAQLSRSGAWGIFSDRIRAMCSLHGLRKIAVASDSNNIRIFDTNTSEVTNVIEWHQSGLFAKIRKKTLSLASSRYGLLAAGGADGSLSLFEAGSFSLKNRLNMGPGEIVSLSFSPDGNFLAAALNLKLVILQVPELKVIHELKHTSSPLSTSFSYDCRIIASGSSNCQIRLFHLNTGQELHKLTHHTGAVLSLDFSDISQSLVSAGADRRVFVTNFSW